MNFDFLSTIELHSALVTVVPVLIILGFALKNTPKVPDWTIVWVLLLLGALAGVLAVGFNVEGFANGVIAAGLAIASHQAFKQTVERL